MLEPVVQKEATGCGIASVANILGKTYSEMKAAANALVSMLRTNRCGQIRTMSDVCCRAQVSKLLLMRPHLILGSAWGANLPCLIRLVTCHPISVRILMPCSPSGSLRSKMHSQALLSPLKRLGRLTLRSSGPKLIVIKENKL